jgi:hypothetical protein
MSKRMNRRLSSYGLQRRRTKQRKTFTLSPESVAFLEQLSANRADSRGQQSVSAVLDDLLLAVVKDKQRQEIEEKIGRYYDERSKAEEQEELDWGKFAMGEFVAIELSKSRR